MKRTVFSFAILAYSSFASAQWAVLDQSVLEVVKEIRATGSGKKEFEKFTPAAVIESSFDTVSLTNPERFIGTTADCGDVQLNEHHYKACMGLRNLRLKTLEQTVDVLKKIQDRRGEITRVLADGESADKAGGLQRQQFILQGIQTQLQNDAMELEAVRYGYQQRAIIYETQMAEARRATDTRAPAGPAGFRVTLPVKFPR